MVLPHGSGDLYHKYRPQKFGEIAGHKEVITSIRKAISARHPSQAYLLTGDSGTGKTSTARIMSLALNCDERDEAGEPCLRCTPCRIIISGNCTDIKEVNAADHRGIGDIRQLCQQMPLMPMHVRNKVFILDEAHQLTTDAQSSLLKELEEAPGHVYIILCSTHPKKILPTVKNRCQRFRFNLLRRSEMLSLVEEVATLEGEDFSGKVYEAITDASGGSPRNALVLLQQVVQLGSKSLSEILRLLNDEEQEDPSVIELCFALNKRTQWQQLVGLYNDVKHMGPPAIGMIIAGFFRNQLLKATTPGRKQQCAGVLELFVSPLPEGKLGENQLVLNLHKATSLL